MSFQSQSQDSKDHLPFEIVQDIIGWNAHLRKELFSCSLVSRIWRTATLPFIFKEAMIFTPRLLRKWSDLLKSAPEMSKHFRVVAIGIEAMEEYEPEEYEDPLPILASFPMLPAVIELAWFELGAVTRVTPEVGHFLKAFPNLRKLCISSKFADTNHLKVFLGYCTSAKDLALYDLTLESPVESCGLEDEGLEVSRFDLSQLEHLEFSAESSSFFDWTLDTILHDSRSKDLRSITLRSESFTLPALLRLLEEFHSTLTHLSIQPLIEKESTFLPIRSLRALPSSLPPLPELHTLTVTSIMLGTISSYLFPLIIQPETIISWICDMIKRVDAPKLVVLELDFSAYRPSEIENALKSCPWKDLTACALGKFPGIQRLGLQFWSSGKEFRKSDSREKVESLVQEYIPKSIFGGRQVSVKWDVEWRDGYEE